MTDPYSNTPTADDILDDVDGPTADLDRRADAILDEGRTFGRTTSVRRAVREDIHAGRAFVRSRAEHARDVIVEEPVKTTLYALGIGVLIGLLLRR